MDKGFHQHVSLLSCYVLIDQDLVFPTLCRSLRSNFVDDGNYGYLELVFEMVEAEFKVLAFKSKQILHCTLFKDARPCRTLRNDVVSMPPQLGAPSSIRLPHVSVGTLSNHDGNANENVVSNYMFQFVQLVQCGQTILEKNW